MNVLSSYLFWLLLASLCCLLLERIAPWRHDQKLVRPQLFQDVFWLLFNGYLAGIVFRLPFRQLYQTLDKTYSGLTGQLPASVKLISNLPFILQILIVLIVADFIEWLVHNLLHRVPVLWKIHRIHHSIKIMDWIGNFRFHWGELFIYKPVKYLSLALLGARWEVVLTSAVISTAIGHLNHSNINISWGPLRYIFNSPRMHIWHHEKALRGKAGTNFAVVFSFWDWIFGTAYMPKNASYPEIGFSGEDRIFNGLAGRFFLPFVDRK